MNERKKKSYVVGATVVLSAVLAFLARAAGMSRVLFTAVGGAGFMGIEEEGEEDRCGVGSGEEVSQVEVSWRQLGT